MLSIMSSLAPLITPLRSGSTRLCLGVLDANRLRFIVLPGDRILALRDVIAGITFGGDRSLLTIDVAEVLLDPGDLTIGFCSDGAALACFGTELAGAAPLHPHTLLQRAAFTALV